MGDQASNDFVDYFFQKEGDTFISQLLRLREDYTLQTSQALGRASASERNDYDDFNARLLAPNKILPKITRVENFDFDKALASVFESLDVDVCDTLEMITKYYGFISNLQNHWKGLELVPSTVIETSVQLMATLESIVYPLFLKLTNYIGAIGQNPEKACGPTTPELMMERLHKLSEALTMEIATIGSSGVVTLSQCPTTTRDSMLADSAKLGAQSRSAKNCIAWALQALAPSLQFYFLKFQTYIPEQPNKPCASHTQTEDEGTHVPRHAKSQLMSASEGAEVTEESPLLPLKTESMAELEEDGEQENLTSDFNDSVAKEPSGDDLDESVSRSDAQIQAQDDRFVTTESTMVQADDDEVERSESEMSMSENESEANISLVKKKDKVTRKVPEEAEEFQTETRNNNGPELENDFVSYFFKKNGIKYVAILAQTKKKYEERCKGLLASNSDWKRTAMSFMDTVHDVRKISPTSVSPAPGVDEVDFVSLLARAVEDFEIDIEDKMTLIKSYQEYTKGMIRHWKYRIENEKPLSVDTIVDIGIQMMATTMALVYPIFIRIAEAIRKLAKSDLTEQKFTPEGLAARLHVLVEINARQLTAIGTSVLGVVALLPNISREELRDKEVLMESQMTLAKNSVSWAMKAISPLLLLYFINVIKIARGQKSETSLSGSSPGQKQTQSVQSMASVGSVQSMASEASVQSMASEASLASIQSEASVQSMASQASVQSMASEASLQGGDDEEDERLAKARKFYKAPKQSKNLVFYFYAKEGQQYSSILTKLRTQYEGLVMKAMENADHSVKEKVKDFVQQFHEARKATVPRMDVDLQDIMFKEAVNKIFAGLEMDIQDNCATLVKYFEFSKKLETHWNYRINKGLELHQDAVLEMSIEMMGTTVALSYPIFIKIAEYTVSILNNRQVSFARHTPEELVTKFKKFITLLTTELAAIGMTCTAIMASLPNATRDSVTSRATKLANETKTADGSLSWAMKAIFPIFMLYFLQYWQSTGA